MRNFTLCLFICLSSFSFSQDLLNTKWKFLQTGFDTLVVKFETDTFRIFNKVETIEYVVGWYKESADTLWTYDLYSPGQVATICDPTDTGVYHFNISNNVLVFTLIKDDCALRVDDMSEPWYRVNPLPTNIKSSAEAIDYGLYPNPSQGEFFIDAPVPGRYEILNIQGNTLLRSNLMRGKNLISIESDPGIYFVRILTDGNWHTQRLFIE